MGSNRRIERAVRRSRPEARDTFVADLTARVDGTPAAPVRPRRVRYGLAAAMTALALLVAASMGGFSYAANSMQAAGGKVVKVVKKPKKKATRRVKPVGASRYLASFTTYTLGDWACHWEQGQPYNDGQKKRPQYWTPIRITTIALAGIHGPHIGDYMYGPPGGQSEPSSTDVLRRRPSPVRCPTAQLQQ